jgi:acyl carrier protein
MDESDLFQRYTSLLRAHLPYSGSGPLEKTAKLADLGLDSLGLIQLLVDLEEEFAVEFPDDLLTAETFESVMSLWNSFMSVTETGGHGGA